uniref:EF-hand domain-containing protein n=1 Tax=Nelumbo nucifera TaxID=4432 RepID=A0A822ZQT5_NELNU|nr:TPA_asm: hypothetical protein HUJ06_002408 [Nelumbo nucifera]
MGGAMLPIFHDDLIKHTQHDLVEVTPELEYDSILVCSVTPTASGEPSGEGTTSSPPFFHRNLSFTSRIRQKFPWLTSPSAQASSHCTSTPPFFQHNLSITSRIRQKFPWLASPSAQTASQFEEPTASARDARKITAQLERTRSKARRTLTGLRFISRTTDDKDTTELWRKVESRFKSLAKDGLLSREDFGQCIGTLLGIFDALARRRRQKIERITKELYDFWLQVSDQRFDGRLQIFFDIADSNEDGRITREEVQELIKLGASANKLSKLKEQAEEYASLIMEELDPENLGYIELWQLEALLLERDKYMSYSRALSMASSVGWSQNLETIKPKKVGVARRINSKVLRCLILEKWQRAWVITLWVLAMAALFACKFNQYRKKAAFQVMGYCLTTAKGAAETLKLNMALILLPVCRNTLTRLRSTRARLFVPLDDNINLHKMIAYAIVIGILLHVGTHLVCDFPRLINSTAQQFALISSDFNHKKPTYLDLLKGVEGVTGIAMLILIAISFTLATHHFRKNVVSLPPPLNRLTGFNVFWYSHHLLALVYILLLVHGYFLFLAHNWYNKTTWMYISILLLLYLGERSLRASRSTHFSVNIFKLVFTLITGFSATRKCVELSHVKAPKF